MPWGRAGRCSGSKAQAGGDSLSTSESLQGEGRPWQGRKTQLLLRESWSDLNRKGALHITLSKSNILLTYFALGHFGFPLAAR